MDENAVIDLVRVEFQVVGTVLHGIADGIGANEGNFAFQAAVDGVVVCADFNQCRLACADKGDVLRTDIGFDQQFVVNRDDLHNVFACVHNAADGGNFYAFDDAAHRGADLRAFNRIGTHGNVFFGLRQLGFGLQKFVVGIGFVAVAALGNLGGQVGRLTAHS